MKDLPECDGQKPVADAARALSQEYVDAAYGQRRWGTGASHLAVAIDHTNQQMSKLSPQQQVCFENQLHSGYAFDPKSDQTLQLSLIYLKENAKLISRSWDLQISREDLQKHADMPFVSKPERVLIEHALKNFDVIRSGNRFDGDSWVPTIARELFNKPDNSLNITPLDIEGHQRQFARYAAQEG